MVSRVSPDPWLDSPEPDATVAESAAASAYRVKLDVFEGPLDLLLYLIKKEQVSIYDIPIARITEQYLDYLRAMEELDITVASDFLVMAATLIYIKSKMLLPPDPSDGGEDGAVDPRQELVERLLQHQVYKAAAEMLWSRAEREEGVFPRGRLETDDVNPEVAATLFDLFAAFQRVMERLKERRELTIARDEITTAETLARLRQLIQTQEQIDVTALLEGARSLRELLTLFLAVLELVKEAMIRLVQTERFGPIIALRCQT
ncbi:MAG TPA: segregation/condensation protein A [Blastocatellia bacterium]|nr:segregation/condensation protein A [Blastocatellia bacterium]